jgi:hypothetical protein
MKRSIVPHGKNMKRLSTLSVCFSLWSAAVVCAETPLSLTGTWEDSYRSEQGTITITITKENGVVIEGVLQITGSKECRAPIPFRGARSEREVTVIADAPGVCGYNGVLSAVATKNGPPDLEHETYTGVFDYRLFGGVWKKGTFELRPLQVPQK